MPNPRPDRQVKVTITDWQVEVLLSAFAESGNMSYATQEAGVKYATGRSYILANLETFQEARKEHRLDVINQFALARRLALQELADPERLKATSTKDLAILVGVLTDKHQLLSGGPTASIAFQRYDPLALTPEERETARQFRERMEASRAAQVNVVDVEGVVK